MTYNKSINFSILRIKLLQYCQDKNARLSHSQLRLTNNIRTQHSLWNTILLHFRRMFETTILNNKKEFLFQKKISETRRMNSNIGPLLYFFRLGDRFIFIS